jgi:hypothetical protein
MIDRDALEKKAKSLEEQAALTKEENLPAVSEENAIAKQSNLHSNFGNYLTDTYKEKFSKVDASAFRKEMLRYSDRSRYRPIRTCKVEECELALANECPLHRVGAAPLGERCAVDMFEMDAVYDKYRTMLEDQKIDAPMIDIHIVDLVMVSMNIIKIQNVISNKGFMTKTPVFGFPKTEEVVWGEKASDLPDILEKFYNRRDKILKSMLFTPESRARFKLTDEKDINAIIDDIRRRAEAKMSKRMKDVIVQEPLEIDKNPKEGELDNAEPS